MKLILTILLTFTALIAVVAQQERQLKRGNYLPKSSYEYPNNSTEGFKLDSHPIKSFKITDDGFILYQHNLLIPSLFTPFIKSTKSAIKSGFQYTWSYDEGNTVILLVKYSKELNSYLPTEMRIKHTEPTSPDQRKATPRHFRIYF